MNNHLTFVGKETLFTLTKLSPAELSNEPTEQAFFMKYFMENYAKVATFAFTVGLATMPLVSNADTFTLTDNNASTVITPGSESGMSGLTVDGTTQLYKQTFFYRVDQNKEKAISTIPSSSVQATANTLSSLYTATSFKIEVDYSLLGGPSGSGAAAVTEQIKISNLTGSTLDFHFFQYVDFDLGGDWLGDSVTLEQDLQGKFIRAVQNKGNFYFADEILSPAADHGEVGLSQSILTKLTDIFPTTLNDSTGPVSGDAVWAFQWDLSIPAYDSFSIAINKSVYLAVPEPSSLGLVALGAIALGAMRRRTNLLK
jgi:hypothetical protein